MYSDRGLALFASAIDRIFSDVLSDEERRGAARMLAILTKEVLLARMAEEWYRPKDETLTIRIVAALYALSKDGVEAHKDAYNEQIAEFALRHEALQSKT